MRGLYMYVYILHRCISVFPWYSRSIFHDIWTNLTLNSYKWNGPTPATRVKHITCIRSQACLSVSFGWLFACVCTYIYIYMCVCVCMYIYIYVYIHTHSHYNPCNISGGLYDDSIFPLHSHSYSKWGCPKISIWGFPWMGNPQVDGL